MVDPDRFVALAALIRNESYFEQQQKVLPPSDEEVEALSVVLKSSRTSILLQRKDHLQSLSIECIVQNYLRFLAPAWTSNPFEKLPNELVLIILKTLQLVFKRPAHELVASLKGQQYHFVLQLLNQFLEDGNEAFQIVRDLGLSDFGHSALLKHMLHNCPKIKTIYHDNSTLTDLAVIPKLNKPTDLHKMMAAKWQNLTLLKQVSSSGSGFDDDAILLDISTYIPNLSELDITLSSFTMKGVQHMSNMRRLKVLALSGTEDATLLAHAAGQVASLEHFNFCQSAYYCNKKEKEVSCSQFVEAYAELYPEKQLVIRKLWFDSNFELSKWPRCLSVEHLDLSSCSSRVVKCLSNSCLAVDKLTLKSECPADIYKLVETFGAAGLSRLDITFNGYKLQSVDPFRIVAACPKLQKLKLWSNGAFQTSSNYDLTPAHFKNCYKLEMNPSSAPVAALYKMFYLGSKKYCPDEIYCTNGEILEAAIWALSQKPAPSCFDSVKLIMVSYEHWNEQKIDRAIQLALLVMARSAALKTASLGVGGLVKIEGQYTPAKWLQTLLQKLGVNLHIRGIFNWSAKCSCCRRDSVE